MHLSQIIILIFHSFLFTVSFKTQNEPESIRKSASGFFFTMPKTLLSGRNETVCLSIHHSLSGATKIISDIKIKNKHYFTTKTFKSEQSCFELYVPELNLTEPQFATVRLQVVLNSSGIVYSAHNIDSIIIYPIRSYVFIETDRGLYKSGDKVKIRIMTLSESLLPPQDYKVAKVIIRNPFDIPVAVWENVSTEFGLAQLEHQLSQDSMEGKWRIEVDEEIRFFEVGKYILPRFEVLLNHPKTIFHKASELNITVCSKYTYGASVKGKAFIRIMDSQNSMQPIQLIKRIQDGCAHFKFSNKDLNLALVERQFQMTDSKMHIKVIATITEHGTEQIELAKARIAISLDPFNLNFAPNGVFRPGLPYHGQVRFNNVYIDLRGQVLEICYNIAIRKSWNYLNNEQCSNFHVADMTELNFTIPPMKSNIIHINVNVRSLNHSNVGDNLLLVRLFSPSSSYIRLKNMYNTRNLKCEPHQHFTIRYTAPPQIMKSDYITFYMMIKSMGQIKTFKKIVHPVQIHSTNFSNELESIVGLNHKYTLESAIFDEFDLKFQLDTSVLSSYQILVYFVTKDGETLAATQSVELKPCLSNWVNASWSHKEISPGGTATLLIQTKSDSLCSITAVDKATKILSHTQNFNINGIIKPFLQEREISEAGRKSCVAPTRKHKNERRKRYVYSFSEDFDAYDIFNKFGILTISNFRLVTKHCYTGPVFSKNRTVQHLTEQYYTQNEEKITSIRSFFPETWLWELIPVRGLSVINRKLPHSITNWETNVLCISNTDGLGFSETVDITTIQPFFVDIVTPYSIKRGETLYLHAIVFSYLNYNVPIRITLGESDDLNLTDSYNRRSMSYCLKGNDTFSHVFEMKATKIGEMNITVLAEFDPSYPGQCGPEVLINKRDVVFKVVVVEPEGYFSRNVQSALLCASGDQTVNNMTWNLTIPKNSVPDTFKTSVILNADLLGQTIENLEELLLIPTGCGEQIMASLAPNLYVLHYLNVTNKLTLSAKQRIIRNLKIGYQRILNYAHKDGSFSAFGYHDISGSMFLTAFVVRTLQEAKEYIYIDQRMIKKAVAWIYEHQLENGCFNTMLHVFQDMGGTSTENSTAALTSYVIISLVEAKIEVPESVINNAKYCIRGYHDLDKYTLAISSYALFKIHWNSEATRILNKLWQISNQKDNMIWWSTKDINGSITTDIEVTSYVLQSLIHQNTYDSMAKAHSVVRWISTKQGPKGGFHSTQDTVVALDALTKYSLLFNFKEINLNVTVKSSGLHNHTFAIAELNRLRSKKITLKKADHKINILAEGKGCVLVHAVSAYYLDHLPRSDAFRLNTEISPVSSVDKCSIATLESCFAYSGPDRQSNMAILEVNLPSGYQADRASLYKLLDESKTANVKMFEEAKQKVVFYLTKLSKEQICLSFTINENVPVGSRSGSLIKIYDYYNPEYNVLQFYKLDDGCKLQKLTIADINKNISLDLEHSVDRDNKLIQN